MLVGDSGVGKSGLLNRFTKDYFDEETEITLGVDFGVKDIQLSNGKSIRLQIWDTAG